MYAHNNISYFSKKATLNNYKKITKCPVNDIAKNTLTYSYLVNKKI